MSLTQAVSCVGEDGIIHCYHGTQAAHRTAKTAQNYGRAFYCCPLEMEDPDRCRFYKWADDPIFDKATMGSGKKPPSTPAPPANVERRLASIRVALADPTSGTQASPSADGKKRASSSAVGRSSPASLQLDSEELDAIFEPLSGEDSDTETRSAKRFKHAGPSAGRAGSGLLTPPNTVQKPRHQIKLEEPQTPTASRRRGKERAVEPLTEWQTVQVDPANPFDDGEYGLSQSQTLSTSQGSTTDWTPESMSDSFSSMIAYMEKLERKRNAAEKSAAAKSHRIETMQHEFQTERERYEQRISQLEDKIRRRDEKIGALKAAASQSG